MFAILNYLQNYETKITQSEIPELQFLDTDLYKNENFNVNNFVQVIMSKLNDTNYLLNQLRLTTDNLKNEIVEQINSNFNNYVVLISKLQTIDFLIENIDKPLQHIKKRIISEINFLEKYEDELKSILLYIKENENQIQMIQLSLKFFKFYENCKSISKELENKYEGDIILNIISNHPDEYILKNNNYDVLRKFLVDFFRFLNPLQNLYQIYQNNLKDDSYTIMITEVRQIEIKYLSHVEDLLKIFINEFFQKKDKKLLNNLINNMLSLIFQIFENSKNQNLLFTKILENGLSNQISQIFDSNKNLNLKIEELNILYESKYIFFSEYLEDPQQFYVFCFILPIIDKLNNEKFIYNCINPETFKENYNSIINLFSKYLQSLNQNEKYYFKIKTFLHSFSHFTYFQYLQNEISKLFTDLTTEEVSKENFETFINISLINYNNLIFNFTKSINDLFREKKMFLKLIPNFLNFILQCLKYITKKQNEFFKDENMTKLLNLINNWTGKFSFEEANLSLMKKNIIEYLNSLNKMITFFTQESDDKNNFFNGMNNVLEKENFMLSQNEELKQMQQKLNESRNLIKNNLFKELNYFDEECFIQQMFKIVEINTEIKSEIKSEINLE